MSIPLVDLKAQYRSIKPEVDAAVAGVLERCDFILGAAVGEFERDFAAFVGTKHCVSVASGTDALWMAMQALGIGAGDKVLLPSNTFIATALAVSDAGATPVLVDMDPATYTIDVAAARKALVPGVKAIIPVHLYGQAADMDPISAIASGRGIPVIEDAAQAIGAKRHGHKACSMSHAGCLSFYPTKNLGAFGDAGAICTSDEAFYEKCKLLRVHGSGHTYYHQFVGGMFRLDAIQAVVLEVKLKYLDGWHEARRRNAAIYDEMLAGSAVKTPRILEGNYSIYNQYVVRVPNRDAVKQKLADRGIGSGIYYPMGLHLQECFKSLGYKPGDLPESEKACAEVLALPVYPELSEEQVRYTAREILEATAA